MDKSTINKYEQLGWCFIIDDWEHPHSGNWNRNYEIYKPNSKEVNSYLNFEKCTQEEMLEDILRRERHKLVYDNKEYILDQVIDSLRKFPNKSRITIDLSAYLEE